MSTDQLSDLRIPKDSGMTIWILAAIFVILCFSIVLLGILTFRSSESQYRVKVEHQLESITELKVREIAEWRQERLRDAELFRQNVAFSSLVRKYLETPLNGEAKNLLQNWLTHVHNTQGYEQVLLLDQDNSLKLSFPETADSSFVHISATSAAVVRSGFATFEDLYWDNTRKKPAFLLLIPIQDDRDPQKGIATMIFHIDPARYLYPFIKRWPTPSETAETLLVRREGSDVLFLNEIRFKADSALKLRIPLSQTQTPAVQAVLGHEGIFEGKDYRGVPVLSVLRKIPDSPWSLVTRMDFTEINAPMQERLWGIILLTGALILGVAGGMWAIWRQIRSRVYKALAANAESLQDLSENLEITLHSIGDAVLATDIDGRVTRMNPVAENLTGWTFSEAKGRQLLEVFHIINAQTRLPAKCPVSHVLETGQIVGLANHTVLISKSGAEFQIADSAAPIRDTTKKICGVVLVFRDVTKEYATEEALRKSQAILQAAMDQSPAGIAIADVPSGQLRYVNDAGLLIRGGNRKDIVEGVGINEYVASWKLLDLDGRPLRMDQVPLARAVMFGETNSRDFIIRRGEEDRIVSANAAPIKNDQGKVIAAIVVFTDITLLKKDEAERAILEARIHQHEKMDAIGQLAGGIAHDFNNQLAGILGYADVLSQRLTDSKLIGFAQTIKTSARRAADLTQQLLAFSRKGKHLSLTIDTHQLIQEVTGFLLHSIDKRIEIVHRLEADFRCIVGDPSQIQNAILNLGLNARDAMPSGGQLIFATKNHNLTTDSPTEELSAGHYIQISVTDTGCGMDQDTQRRLFEPFFTTKEVGKGTGLGLASVYGTVKNHGGTIRVYSEVGHGSTFNIYLPVSKEIAENSLSKDESGIRSLKHGRILVVDDETVILGLVAELLRDQGYRVDVCSDSNAALALYKTDWANIDLVILDMIMPKIGGKDLFLAMKEVNPQIKALLASGYGLNNEAQSILDAGVIDFIQKPFERAALLKKVFEALRPRL